ncbi:MAG: hypothetical protein WC955_04115 [Elusimicrobiota bacterium]
MIDRQHGKLVQRLDVLPMAKMLLAAELSGMLDLTEDEFSKLVRTTENDSIFQKLVKPADTKSKPPITFERLPGTQMAKAYFEFKEEISSDAENVDVETVLSSKDEVVKLIQVLGIEKFKKYFLYNHSMLNYDEIAAELGIEVDKVKKISTVIDEISIHSEFFHPSSLPSAPEVRYNKVASIEEGVVPGQYNIGFFSTRYIRGKYKIDYAQLEAAKKIGVLTPEEAKRLKQFVRNLELINCRKDNLYRIIQRIIEVQHNFLSSRNYDELQPYTQRNLAEDLGLSTSIICRTINGRSVDTPWGDEVPLKDFFPHPRQRKQLLARQILEDSRWGITDIELTRRMFDKFGIRISRRTANLYRQTLKKEDEKRNK